MLLPFRPENYGPKVAAILALAGESATDDGAAGARPMDLFPRACTSEAAREALMTSDARELFPHARDPESALAGLLLYFSCLNEAHELIHRFETSDGAYWHGIMHRMEGDAYNAGYWFRYVRSHPVFPALASEAAQLGYAPGPTWDPFAFIRFCKAATPGSAEDQLARRVQLAEWQLLFDYCAAAHTRSQSGAAAR